MPKAHVCTPGTGPLQQVTIGKEAFEPTPATTPAGAPSRVSCYSATISIPKDASATVEVSTSFTGVLTPNPRAIRQGDQQLVEYEDTLWPVSPYKIQQQSTTAILPTEGILSHSRPEDTVNKVTRLVWGSLGAAEPWSLEPLRVHFHHDKPFKKVVSLVREIEVSHWGNIYVEEAYVIANAGSEHKGPFSRLRYQLEGGRANSFQVGLPAEVVT
ncbi:oligosaccharyltransferase complex subunit alpha (ribophorin I) [Monoraphidium neglectum]|uniref:Dolichyl-diphosphooligosaccharide--protein glycosyltransferase subunit 1 n=1 Tax=Monoraphidium neglectum TaxID=145388 RepID=A0A0D2K2F6_9CHLO|nr:oligosaccharyltransferase complex subunit alpha (ribophorin I) [Monoraphidium neglectum]KIZ04728.1 oligosaccharyltransferase complex subunit alpha (ribophorin I) [Monoraphidium neglectum]|eukprot:XP_013903747.1 oligosaccharyltransferase complex subunit alpha (ribophorin I) [Monoraphidium neglectum]